MKVVKLLDNRRALAELDGVVIDVSIELVGEVPIGSYVIVHAGFAIETLDLDEAEKTLTIMDELLSLKTEEHPPA